MGQQTIGVKIADFLCELGFVTGAEAQAIALVMKAFGKFIANSPVCAADHDHTAIR